MPNLLLARRDVTCFDYRMKRGLSVGAIDTVSCTKNVRQVENFLMKSFEIVSRAQRSDAEKLLLTWI